MLSSILKTISSLNLTCHFFSFANVCLTLHYLPRKFELQLIQLQMDITLKPRFLVVDICATHRVLYTRIIANSTKKCSGAKCNNPSFFYHNKDCNVRITFWITLWNPLLKKEKMFFKCKTFHAETSTYNNKKQKNTFAYGNDRLLQV